MSRRCSRRAARGHSQSNADRGVPIGERSPQPQTRKIKIPIAFTEKAFVVVISSCEVRNGSRCGNRQRNSENGSPTGQKRSKGLILWDNCVEWSPSKGRFGLAFPTPKSAFRNVQPRVFLGHYFSFSRGEKRGCPSGEVPRPTLCYLQHRESD